MDRKSQGQDLLPGIGDTGWEYFVLNFYAIRVDKNKLNYSNNVVFRKVRRAYENSWDQRCRMFFCCSVASNSKIKVGDISSSKEYNFQISFHHSRAHSRKLPVFYPNFSETWMLFPAMCWLVWFCWDRDNKQPGNTSSPRLDPQP